MMMMVVSTKVRAQGDETLSALLQLQACARRGNLIRRTRTKHTRGRLEEKTHFLVSYRPLALLVNPPQPVVQVSLALLGNQVDCAFLTSGIGRTINDAP